MLPDVGQALGDDVVGRDLDLLGQPAVQVDAEPDRRRRLRGNRLERDLETVSAEDRRVQAARHGAKLVERDGNLAPRSIEASCRLRVGRQLLLEQAQLQRQRDQPLLRAVVQIAFQPLPLLLARLR